MKNQKITYSAPGKVILSGEHAVVYGKPALVSAIDLRLKSTASFADHPSQDRGAMEVEKAVKAYLRKHAISFPDRGITFETQSDIPSGRGLGSSAAFGVASVAAALHLLTNGKQFKKDIVNSIAYQVEKYFHAQASGADNSTSCFGGLVYYRKEFEFLKSISVLSYKIPAVIQSHLFLIDTGKPLESTGDMVNSVGRLYNHDANTVETIFNRIERVAKRMVVAIIKEDAPFFRQCIQENQTLLKQIGIVSPSAELILQELEAYGAAKIVGAGGHKEGSGFILFYADNPTRFELYAKNKLTYFKFVPSVEGVRQEL